MLSVQSKRNGQSPSSVVGSSVSISQSIWKAIIWCQTPQRILATVPWSNSHGQGTWIYLSYGFQKIRIYWTKILWVFKSFFLCPEQHTYEYFYLGFIHNEHKLRFHLNMLTPQYNIHLDFFLNYLISKHIFSFLIFLILLSISLLCKI